MADPIGSLYVELAASTAKFMSDLEKAQAKLKDTAKTGREVETSFTKLGTAALATVASITAMALAAGRQAEQLSQLSAITGINTDKLQEYDVALNRVGLSGEDMTVMMRTLSKNLEEAQNGTGKAADRFRQLGIDITKVTSTDDLIRKIAAAVGQFANGAEKAAIVGDLLGKSGLKFIPLFDRGSKAFDEAAASSKRLGETLNTLQLDTLGRMDDAVDDLSIAWKRFGQQVGAFVAPGVELVVNLFTQMLSIGSMVFKEMDIAADTLAIRFTHIALAVQEVASVLFSTSVVSGEAWAQVGENLKVIDQEAAKLIAKRRELSNLTAPDDGRKAPPKLIDTAQMAKQAQSLADANRQFNESLFKNAESMAQAQEQRMRAHLDAQKQLHLKSDLDIARESAAIQAEMSSVALENIQKEIKNYSAFYQQKRQLFTTDEKGMAEAKQFEIESSQHMIELLHKEAIAQINADAERVKSATQTGVAIRAAKLQPLDDEIRKLQVLDELQASLYASEQGFLGASEAARQTRFNLIEAEVALQKEKARQTIVGEQRLQDELHNIDLQADAKRRQVIMEFPDFFEQQMQDLVSSNSFSLSQISTQWTSGLANSIVKGGDFVKQAWEATQVAMLNAVLNTGIQMAARWALNQSIELGLIQATEAAKLGLQTTALANESQNATSRVAIHTSMETAKTAATEAGEAARLATAIATNKAIAAASLAALAPIAMVGQAAIMVMTTAMEVVAGMMAAIAAALTAGVYTAVLAPPVAAAAAGLASAAPGLAAAATAAMQGALTAAAGTVALAKGGIVNSDTLARIGEAGSPEAVIPLNDRGAGFMQKIMGGYSPMESNRILQVHNHVMLDGRELAHGTVDYFIDALRLRGATV